MAKAEHPHFGIGEATDGSFKPDDDLSPEELEASHADNAEAARARAAENAATLAVKSAEVEDDYYSHYMQIIDQEESEFELKRILDNSITPDFEAGLITIEEYESLKARIATRLKYLEYMGSNTSDTWKPYKD